jgi:hypothetical protein
MSDLNPAKWRAIIRQIKRGKATPLISNLVHSQPIFGTDSIVQRWAGEIGYPWTDDQRLSKVAQYLSVTSGDALLAKDEYLDFLKRNLMEAARIDQTPAHKSFLDLLEDELFDLSFSETAKRLGHPNFGEAALNPLQVLAELPLPIYLTTSYYSFMEDALLAAGKQPQKEICHWHQGLQAIPSVFADNPDFEPTPETPLVYHLLGSDEFPSSLVLSEDDFLDFLVAVSRDSTIIPTRIAQALADSALLMLGYSLWNWDFRALFRGIIKDKPSSRRPASLSIQLEPITTDAQPDKESQIQEYFRVCFNEYKFDIYWGDVQSFTEELWHYWENS